MLILQTTANEHAKKLYDKLMANYSKMIRPVSNSSSSLTIRLGLKLAQLIGVVSCTPHYHQSCLTLRLF